MLFIISLLLSCATGWFIVGLAWKTPISGYLVLINSCLAIAAGCALSSMVFFLSATFFAPAILPDLVIELVLLVSSAGLWWRHRAGQDHGQPAAHSSRATWIVPAYIRALLGISFLIGLITLFMIARDQADGSWDAWAFWNTHARFLLRGGADWGSVFTLTNYFHPDYPWLVPSLVARGWMFTNSETLFVPSFISLLFTLTTCVIIGGTLTMLRSRLQGGIALALLLGNSTFVINGAGQVADIPVSLYLLSALIVWRLAELSIMRQLPAMGLIGFLLACTAWAKNEGLVVFTLGSIVFSSALWRTYKEDCWKSVAALIIGAIPGVCMLIVLKFILAPAGDLLSAQSEQSVLAKLLNVSRYIDIIRLYIAGLIRFGRGIGIILLIYGLLIGSVRRKWRAVCVPLLIIILVQIVYLGVYVLTPFDVEWHISASLARLLLQVWPSLVFTVLLVLNVPGDSARVT